MKICKIENCENKHRSKGLCSKHYKQLWFQQNKNRIYKEYREVRKQRRKNHYEKNKNKEKANHKIWRLKNLKNRLQYYKNWYEKNKQSVLKRSALYRKSKIKTDLQYKLRHILRSRFYSALRGKYKAGSAITLLGCSIEEFVVYLSLKFQPGMNWNNYGRDGWHIDHIKPLKLFDLTNVDHLKKALHYTNLQPLWKAQNLSKGSKYEV